MANTTVDRGGEYKFNSFSGVDIKAVFQGHTIGTLQQLSYKMTQQKAPVYTMGSKFPRGFSYGTMMVVGTLVFTMIDKDELLFAMREVASRDDKFKPWLDKEDAMPTAFAAHIPAPRVNQNTQVDTFQATGVQRVDGRPATTAEAMDGVFVGEDELDTLTSDQILSLPNYVTEIPPFAITLVASNEMGRSSTMSIHGVNIITEGYQISIDHITSDLALEFIAASIMPWVPIERSV